MCWTPAASCATTAPPRSPTTQRWRLPISAAPRPPSSPAMSIDLILRNARIIGRDGALFDVGVADGRIADIAPQIAADAPDLQLDGKLVHAGFVETHIHLDKSCILDRCVSEDGTLQEA